MSTQVQAQAPEAENYRFFDGYTRVILAIMFAVLLAIFASGKYMSAHDMKGIGTDDSVNDAAAATIRGEHHPFVDLPGDAEVSAFSVANFFAGLIVGYHWLKLFGDKPRRSGEKKDD